MALLAAAGWAVLRGILELGPGSLVVAFLGGWGIGVFVRRAGASPLLARASPVLAGRAGVRGVAVGPGLHVAPGHGHPARLDADLA